MRILLLMAILIPQLGYAGVFMCVDPVTGKKSFTDRACPKAEAGQEVKVEPGNFGDRGHAQQRRPGQQAWDSQRDTRVSGRANYKTKPASQDHSNTRSSEEIAAR